jgi:hypothetical protein
MSPTSTFFRAARTARPAFRASQFFRPKQTRFQSTTAGGESESFAKRMWNSPVGLKTVHFWYLSRYPPSVHRKLARMLTAIRPYAGRP